MRARVIPFVLFAMLVALVYLTVTREHDPHVMPPPRPEEPAVVVDAGVNDAGAAPSSVVDAVVEDANAAASARADAHAPLLDRPLRVASASWELVASALVANGGRTTGDGSAMRAGGVTAQIDVVTDDRDVEGRLARGGADADGADVAVVPLAELVASYERLRALEPEVVFVVGWSRGREVLFGARDGMLSRPRPDETTVIGGDVAATSLALFALDEAGVGPRRLRVVADAKNAPFAALARPVPTDRAPDAPAKLLLSTADASALMPLVAVASRGFVEQHTAALGAVLHAWLDGATALRKDVPGAARRIAAEPNAPDPAAMLERLGWMTDLSVREQARALGIVGRDPVTIASLFARHWRLLRDLGTLTSPAPQAAPIATAPLVKALGELKTAQAPPSPPVAADPSARVLLAHKIDKPDVDAVAAEVAWLAGVFGQSGIRVSARASGLARDAAAAAHDKLDVPSERIVVGSPPSDASALVEVLAAP